MKQTNQSALEKDTFHHIETSLVKCLGVLHRHQEHIQLKYKVSSQEMSLIQYLIENGPQKMKTISEHFFIKLSTLTTTIDKAERKQVVARYQSQSDRRVIQLKVTEKGKRIFQSYRRDLSGLVQNFAQKFDEKDLLMFIQSLESFAKL